MVGICGCTIGPPVGGVCQACGAVGPRAPWQLPPGYDYAQIVPPLTAEDVRRIVREEIERARAADGDIG